MPRNRKNEVGVVSSLKPNRNGAAMSTPARTKSSTTWVATGTELMSEVGPSVLAARMRTMTPATTASAVAALESKLNRNGAVISRIAATYSIAPCRKCEIGP